MAPDPECHPRGTAPTLPTASYEETVFAWMSDWQPDVRVLVPEKESD